MNLIFSDLLETDGNFPNTSLNVWPQSWWQRFVYQLGNDPNTGALYPFRQPFRSADSSDFPDWPIFVDVFGTAQCYRNNPPSRYNSSAITRWGGWKQNWGGSCFGFAISSLIGFYWPGILINQFPGIGNFGALFNVPLSNDARRAINHFYTTQYGREFSQYMNMHRSNTPRQLLANLKKMFRKENGDGRILVFLNNNGSGGHAVTPYKLERVGNTSTFNLRLYDSNAPGSSNQIIFIDSTLNRWTDNTGLGWGTGSVNCFLSESSFKFLFTPTLGPIQLQSTANKEISAGTSRVTIFNTINAYIIITSGNGEQIGYQDSIVFNNFSDAIPLIPLNGSVHPPIGYYLPEDAYSLQINNFTDSSSYVFFLSDSTIYNYRRFDANNNEVDVLNFSESGVGITNPDPADKNTFLETIILEDSTSEKVFVTSNVKISAGDSIRIREKDRNELLLQNYGESMSYDLQTRITSESGQAVFFHMAIPMDQNSAHQIVPDWNDLINIPIIIYIDLGNDGIIDDTLMLKNQITNVEDRGNLYIPKEYKLEQNYPNPFNPTTTIKYSIPEESFVILKVYNLIGEEVATLVNAEQSTGNYEIEFNAVTLPSGIYFYRLQTENFVDTKKMMLMK